jgi:putative oxidoreductase
MKFLEIFGRILFAMVFLFFGVLHFMNADALVQNLLKGWPLAEGLVYVAGMALILAGISIMINVKARLACFLLALFLLICILGVHLPIIMAQKHSSIPLIFSSSKSGIAFTYLLKDIALLGATLSYGASQKN